MSEYVRIPCGHVVDDVAEDAPCAECEENAGVAPIEYRALIASAAQAVEDFGEDELERFAASLSHET